MYKTKEKRVTKRRASHSYVNLLKFIIILYLSKKHKTEHVDKTK
jgi:hypothetical protein